MKVFIICSVRGSSEEYRTKLETYVSELEKNGMKVHLPHRDTNQNARGFDICMQNANAINEADEVHIFYNSASQGTHFDMGVSFALRKKIVVVENEEYGEGKSYPKMLDEWQNEKPCVSNCPSELEPVLAKIEYINSLGKSTWYEVVYFDKHWRCYAGSNTFKDGERVVKWRYCKDLLIFADICSFS